MILTFSHKVKEQIVFLEPVLSVDSASKHVSCVFRHEEEKYKVSLHYYTYGKTQRSRAWFHFESVSDGEDGSWYAPCSSDVSVHVTIEKGADFTQGSPWNTFVFGESALKKVHKQFLKIIPYIKERQEYNRLMDTKRKEYQNNLTV